MKILFYSVLALALSIAAFVFGDESFYYRTTDGPWGRNYGGWVRGFFVITGLAFPIWTYFFILRRHAAKRRKLMDSSYGRTDCPVMTEFDEAVKMLERANYGMANLAPAATPPALSAAGTPPPLPTDHAADAIRAKLVSLQRMKDEGLITAEEHSEKKGELLKQL